MCGAVPPYNALLGGKLVAMLAASPEVVLEYRRRYRSLPSTTLQQAAARARLPIFAFQTGQAHGGAVLAMARDYHDAGRQSAALAVRVMRGERPAGIPFQTVNRTRLIVNLTAARELGLRIPADLVSRADEAIGR